MKVKGPKEKPEDPAIAAAREREQQRADAAYISNTQSLLDDENRRRGRRFGRRVALTGASPVNTPVVSGSAGLPLMSSGAGGIAGYSPSDLGLPSGAFGQIV